MRLWSATRVLRELRAIGLQELASADPDEREEMMDARGLFMIEARYSRALIEAAREDILAPEQWLALETMNGAAAKYLAKQLIAEHKIDPRSYKRPPVPFETRIAVYTHDGFVCRRCRGARRHLEGGERLELDHFVPRVDGGPDTEDNLWTLCGYCNRKKHALWPDERNLEEWIRSGREISPLYLQGWQQHGGAPVPSPERILELRAQGEQERLERLNEELLLDEVLSEDAAPAAAA